MSQQRHVGFLVGLVMVAAVAGAQAGMTATKLRCEYDANPLGIDEPKPRLSWVLDSSDQGQVQTAYQVLAATSKEKLAANEADLWDSGKISSDESIHVAYAGKALASRQRAYWKVRVWDRDGKPSESEPAFWEMGLLKAGDWQAKWISVTPNQPDQPSLEGTAWIWFNEGNPAASAPAGERYFRRAFAIPEGAKIERAQFLLSVDDQFTVYVNGQEAGKSSGAVDAWRKPQNMDVAKYLRPGENVIAIAAVNTGSGAGAIGRLDVAIEGQKAIAVATGSGWKASNKKEEGWEKPGFADAGWAAAKVLGRYGMGPWQAFAGGSSEPACRYLRKGFAINKPIKEARLYASALGVYEASINGERVGDHVFAPGWTDYRKRIHYQTFDVTGLLKQGDNAIGVILGEGWYSGFVGLGGRNRYGSLPLAIAQLAIDYADGTSEVLGTDPSWKATTGGPIIVSDMLMGEDYDARKEMPGWNRAGFNDSAWNAVVAKEVTAPLQAQVGPPVRAMMVLNPKSVNEPKKGSFVFDLGQNMVGYARLKLKGEPGTTVTLRFAEMLNPDGTLYTINYRGAKCTDHYILKGSGEEVYDPKFTFRGFRYVEVSGYPGTPGLDAITGVVLYSDTPAVGSFECSSPMVNQLWRNIVWGQRGNFLAVPTDCPQRDERLGWMGDAQIFIRTATYNMDVAGFFTKWTVDVDDAQSPAGAFPDVTPRVAAGEGTPAWGDAGVICPWTAYQVYGDKRILEQHYAAGCKWVEYIRRNNPSLIWNRRGSDYGDWLSIKADTPKDVLGTAYFAYSTRLVSKMAAALGKTEDAKKYEDLFQQIKAAFNKTFVAPDGRIKGNTQTCYVLALRFDLLPDSLKETAAKYLVDDIQSKDWHLSTGFVGVGYLLPTLTAWGKLDVAYRLLNNDTFPSWGYSIKYGATTIWERWDGWTKEKGFQDPGMNSFNHYSLGSVGEWMFETMGGIDLDPQQPGFKHIIVRPRPGGGMSYTKATYNSIRGRIATDWKVENGTFSLSVTIPANTTATIYVPNGAKGAAVETAGIKSSRAEGADRVYEVGSGTYKFSVDGF